MKKIGLFFLVVVLAFGVAGCKKGDKNADPVGTWSFVLDESCNGADIALVFHIYDNGTFIVDGGLSGTWSVSNDTITLNLPAEALVFTGTVDGGGMSGNFVGSATGCWTAARTSTTP